mgnify:FL=1
MLEAKSTSMHMHHRVLKLIRYCVSMYPSTARDPDVAKVATLFNFIEGRRDDTDITLLMSGLATVGEVISRFPYLYYHASWYGLKNVAKYLGKESHVSKNHWELKYIDANQCSNIAANVARQISSAKNKCNGAMTRVRGVSDKGRSNSSKRKRGKAKQYNRKVRDPTTTIGDVNSEELSDSEKAMRLFTLKVTEMNNLHVERARNIIDVCKNLKAGNFKFLF